MNILAGRYEIIRHLGGGGSAITFLAKDMMQPSKPLCVVKQLRPDKIYPRAIKVFHKEAVILEKLGKHPQIPQLLAHFKEKNNLYIVQEFIPGHPLTKEIYLGKGLSEIAVCKLLKDILEVLLFVHGYGVIHRDIKPQNLIRRREDGKIVLIDFGAVKELGSLIVNSHGEVLSSVIVGTPGYMPKEQSLGQPCLASDVYAVGMTAIAALTGVKPSRLENHPQTGEIIWPQQAQVSQKLAEVINKMVRRHVSLRYSCAKEALEALNLAMQGSTSVPAPIPKPQPITPIQNPAPTSNPQQIISTPTPKTQQITPTPTSSPPSTNFSRRKILQIIGSTVGSFLVTVVGKILFQDTSNEVVIVDATGKIIYRQSLNVKYFVEYLGNGVTLEMAEIPGGNFLMGSPANEHGADDSEIPQHKVTIKPFYMSKFTVTQAQYKAIMGKNPSQFKGEQRPVESVSWDDAVEFCDRLTQKTGRTYRLPSEAEWEYACRAKTITPFHFGDTITTNLANYNGNFTYADAPKGKYRQQTTELGSFPPNAFGLYDMHGNIWEWCQDTWHKNYNDAPNNGSPWIENGNDSRRVVRGGSWRDHSNFCRSAKRAYNKPEIHFSYYGFRVVCNTAASST